MVSRCCCFAALAAIVNACSLRIDPPIAIDEGVRGYRMAVVERGSEYGLRTEAAKEIRE